MKDSEFIIRARRKWVELYAKTQNAALVCRRGGRLRCKDYFQAQKCFECLSLSGDPEQTLDERRLTSRITSG